MKGLLPLVLIGGATFAVFGAAPASANDWGRVRLGGSSYNWGHDHHHGKNRYDARREFKRGFDSGSQQGFRRGYVDGSNGRSFNQSFYGCASGVSRDYRRGFERAYRDAYHKAYDFGHRARDEYRFGNSHYEH